MSLYKLNITGDEGEAQTLFELDEVEASVREQTVEWLREDLPGYFGFGEGNHHCELHAKADDDVDTQGCKDCLEAEEEAVQQEIATYVDGEMSSWMSELETEGYVTIRIGADIPNSVLTYRLTQDA